MKSLFLSFDVKLSNGEIIHWGFRLPSGQDLRGMLVATLDYIQRQDGGAILLLNGKPASNMSDMLGAIEVTTFE